MRRSRIYDERQSDLTGVLEAVRTLATAFAEIAGSVSNMQPRVVVKHVERDTDGNIVRIIEEPS